MTAKPISPSVTVTYWNVLHLQARARWFNSCYGL